MKRFYLPKLSWRHLVVLLVAVASVSSAFAQQQKTGIYLRLWQWGNDEPIAEFKMLEDPKVVFDGQEMRLSTDLIDVIAYDLAGIRKFTYFDYTQVGVNDVEFDAPSFRFDGEQMTVSAPDGGCMVSVYSANGSLVKSENVVGGGVCAVSLSQLGRGVYVVKVNGRTYKIVKK